MSEDFTIHRLCYFYAIMQDLRRSFYSERLQMDPIHLNDSSFVFELLNTKGWIQNIDDKKIHHLQDAELYIQKLNDNPNFNYWVIRLSTNHTSIGVVSCMQRDYLPYADIGFALLPSFEGHGYALEASRALLKTLSELDFTEYLMATVLPDNLSSVNLIKKLGLEYDHDILENDHTLEVYKILLSTLK